LALTTLWFLGCGESCGESPAKGSSRTAPATHGSIGSGGDGAPVRISQFDSAPKKPSEAGSTEGLERLKAADLRARLQKTSTAVFLKIDGPQCQDCELAAPVISSLAKEFSKSLKFYQSDYFEAHGGGLLPSGIVEKPLPAFLMYQDGKATSRLQGLPFPRHKDKKGNPDEALKDYQARLTRWFRDALTQRNLEFTQH
jgi:hypothetical protein